MRHANQLVARLDDATLGEIDGRDTGAGRSDALRRIVRRYASICERDMPALSEDETNLIRDALNGVWLYDGMMSARGVLVAEVEDGIRLNNLGEKWGVDTEALLGTLRSCSEGQAVALVDAVERWWGQGASDQ